MYLHQPTLNLLLPVGISFYTFQGFSLVLATLFFSIQIYCDFSGYSELDDALYVIAHLLDGIRSPYAYFTSGTTALGLNTLNLTIIGLCSFVLLIFDAFNFNNDCIALVSKKGRCIRYLLYMLLLCMILYLKSSTPAEFVYFQF